MREPSLVIFLTFCIVHMIHDYFDSTITILQLLYSLLWTQELVFRGQVKIIT